MSEWVQQWGFLCFSKPACKPCRGCCFDFVGGSQCIKFEDVMVWSLYHCLIRWDNYWGSKNRVLSLFYFMWCARFVVTERAADLGDSKWGYSCSISGVTQHQSVNVNLYQISFCAASLQVYPTPTLLWGPPAPPAQAAEEGECHINTVRLKKISDMKNSKKELAVGKLCSVIIVTEE